MSVEASSPLDFMVSALGLTEALIAAATAGLADQLDGHLQDIKSIRLHHRDALDGGVQSDK